MRYFVLFIVSGIRPYSAFVPVKRAGITLGTGFVDIYKII